MIQHHTVSLKEVNYQIPLYLYPGVGRSSELLLSPWPKGKDGRRTKLDPGFVDRLGQAIDLRFVGPKRSRRHRSPPANVLSP